MPVPGHSDRGVHRPNSGIRSVVQRQRIWFLLLQVVVLAALLPAAAARPAPGPVSLVVTPHPILAFAQDGQRLAWIEQTDRSCEAGRGFRVEVRGLGATTSNMPAGSCSLAGQRIALAGSAVLWTHLWPGMSFYTGVWTVSPGGRPPALVGDADTNYAVVLDGAGDGGYIAAIAGDGTTLVFSVIDLSYGTCDPVESQCELDASGGLVRVDNGRTRAIAGSGGAVALSVASPYVAAVPVAASTFSDPVGSGNRVSTPTATTITIRNAFTGRLVSSFDPAGTPREIALTRTRVAVLVDRSRTIRVEIRDAPTAELLRSVAVPRRTRGISASGNTIVFAASRDIYALDMTTSRVAHLIRAGAAPVGLSIDGRRIAWAENAHGRGTIRALTAP